MRSHAADGVKSAALRSGACFLNSEEEFKNADNFTLFIEKAALTKFKAANVNDELVRSPSTRLFTTI
jgi:hypothetical protein